MTAARSDGEIDPLVLATRADHRGADRWGPENGWSGPTTPRWLARPSSALGDPGLQVGRVQGDQLLAPFLQNAEKSPKSFLGEVCSADFFQGVCEAD